MCCKNCLRVLSYRNENAHGIGRAFEGQTYCGRISDLQCHKVHLERVIFYTRDMQKEDELLDLVAVNIGAAWAQSAVWHIS